MRNNLILNSDSYKYGHHLMVPPNTQYISSYIEARGWGSPFSARPEVLFAGIEPFIQEYLMEPIRRSDIEEAAEVLKAHGEPFNRDGWERVLDVHGGYLPIQITALADGTVTQTGIPLVQVINSDPLLPWVTSFVETMLLRAVWYPTTVATLSREIKKDLSYYLGLTADNLNGLPFKLHDFGARGASSHESAALGGYGHLINFMGTDTIEAVVLIKKLFGTIDGFSIPASEHSTITTWGKDNEAKAYENMIDRFGSGLFACVSDSYDIYNAVSNLWGGELRERIKTMGGTLVVRPDSGDPAEVTLKVIDLLGEKFGFSYNSKNYKVLPSYIRMIQGDGVNQKSIREILTNFVAHGWSADNIAFGMGGALLQGVNRDSLKFAMKANEATIDGKPRPVYKDPVTDHGKHSKMFRQAVVFGRDGRHESVKEMDYVGQNLLVLRYSTGRIYNRPAGFQELRDRARI